MEQRKHQQRSSLSMALEHLRESIDDLYFHNYTTEEEHHALLDIISEVEKRHPQPESSHAQSSPV